MKSIARFEEGEENVNKYKISPTLAGTRFIAVTCTALILALGSSASSWARGSFAQRHPRRAEVDRRGGRINGRINRNLGDLHGHYGQLKHEDRSIHRQQRRDARQNGGYITKGQQHQLNREENGLNHQIRHDEH